VTFILIKGTLLFSRFANASYSQQLNRHCLIQTILRASPHSLYRSPSVNIWM